MISPKFWLKHWKVWHAVKGYPLYDVPHKQAERTLSEDQVQENYAYFMRTRHDRLEFFQRWLWRNFRVNASLDGDGVLALDGWINRYGGGLIGDESSTMLIFDSYHPLWLGEYAGYNVMVDIAIFLGEYLILKRPRLHWEIHRGHPDPDREGAIAGSNLARPIIGGFPRPFQWKTDVFKHGYCSVAGSRQSSRIDYNPVMHGRSHLIGELKTTLHVANLSDRDEEESFIFGDYSNEQL
jgi:hypothetical protein